MIKEYFKQKVQWTNEVGLFEFGIQDCQFDLILLNAHQQRFRGYEFKVTRQDFLKDIQNGKWLKYLDYCHTFTWVCPEGLISPEEIISPAGLLWIKKRDQPFTLRTFEWKRIPKVLEISQEKFNEIVCLFIQRIKWRKDDFI